MRDHLHRGRGLAPAVAPALTLPAHADGLSRALASGRISPAKEALLRAQALFHPARVAAVYGPIAHTGGQYLQNSQLKYPWVPLDHSNRCCFQYGSWIWFRFLSETMNAGVIHQIWDRADAAAGTDRSASGSAAATSPRWC